MLRATREKSGERIDELARQLNLAPAKLEALEADNYEKLASDVFAQGYLRRYGKLLGIDDDLLVRRFNEYLARQRAAEAEAQQAKEDVGAAGALPRWLLPGAVGLLAVLVLAFIYLQTAPDDAAGPIVRSADESAPATEEIAEPAAEEDEPALMQAEPVESEAEQAPEELPLPEASTEESAEDALQISEQTFEDSVAEQAPVNVGSQDAADTAPAPDTGSQETAPEEAVVTDSVDTNAELPLPEEAVSAAGGEDRLSFSFTGECWVEVSNAAGTVIHADLAEAGESLTLEGEAPFSIMLGNARVVGLSYNGEVVPISPRPGNRTARLTVGQ